jgi:glutamine synthetase
MRNSTAFRHLSELSSSIAKLKDIGIEMEKEDVEKVTSLTKFMLDTVSKLSDALGMHDFDSSEEHMQHCAKTIRPMMDKVREYVDALEGEVADDLWSLPKYQEMLFIK